MDFSRSVEAAKIADILNFFRSRNLDSSTAIALLIGPIGPIGAKPLRAHSHKSSTGSTRSKVGGGGATEAGESVMMFMKSEAALDTKKFG